MTYPVYWPLVAGETSAVLKSVDTPFNWRRPTDSLDPLNSGCPAETQYPAKRGPKVAGGMATNGGTMVNLSKKVSEMLKPRIMKHSGAVVPFLPGGNDAL